MNKNQFLTELNQYLTFLTPAERTEVISGYTAKFEEAGAVGEAALILELGTPMVIAIDLKRQIESGKKVVEAPPQKESQNEVSEQETDAPEAEFFDFTDEEAAEEVEEAALGEPAVTPAEAESPKTKSNVMSIIGRSLLSIIIGIVCLAIAGIGVYLVVIMGNLLVTGLQIISQTTNALLMFGGGLIAGALGLLVVWFALWSAISLIVKLFKNLGKSKECDK